MKGPDGRVASNESRFKCPAVLPLDGSHDSAYAQVMSSALKSVVKDLVDELPESELGAARRYLEYLRDAPRLMDDTDLARLDADIAVSLAQARAGRTHSAVDVLERIRTTP